MPQDAIDKAFTVFFSLRDGLSDRVEPLKRHLSQVAGIFSDARAARDTLREADPLIYEFHDLGQPEAADDLAFGTSITYPGRIGEEYYMTKGHFHRIQETAEVYYCLSGQGSMLLENPEGDWDCREMSPGRAVYVPGRWAHRSINTGSEPFVTFFCFRADAGHDYKTIADRGFRKLVVHREGRPVVIDNPKWN